ncbi:MAG: hypothetical protein ACI81L_000682 [Verrucomicrobiales bacterium]|jgi:uncharacterized protein (DUF1800 family)
MALNRAGAAHLLRRAAVGATTAQIDSYVGMTRAAAVERLMNTSVSPGLPGWSLFESGDQDWQAQEKMIEWWVDRMITAPPTVEEKLTLFLHDHFATAREKVESSRLMWDQHVILRTDGMGSFRNLLERICFGSAMLIYLDNESNVAGAEQENFARELMELFTVGNGRFDEDDVVAMAKAWTGHNTIGANRENNWVYDPRYIFRSEDHDNSQKTLFGLTRNWDAEGTLDELCFGVKATATSDYFARKMFQFYVHTNPSQTVVDGLAATFRNSNLNIETLLRAVLLHDEFWADESRYALVKSPAEFMVDIMRRNGLRSSDDSVRWRMEGMGMTLFDPPTVAGWGHNGFWLSTASAWTKSRYTNNLKWGADDRGVLQNLEHLTPDQVVNVILTFFSIFDASARTRQYMRELIVTTREERPWAMAYEPFAVGMFMPEVQCA